MQWIDKINAFIGRAVSWLTVLLVIIIVVDVALRYAFSVTSAASFELEWHLFAIIFLLGAAWTLQEDKHVRVDVFYHQFSTKGKAWINIVGSVLLLLPFCTVGFWESLSFVQSSFELNETSPQPGGLPYRYIIKSAIPVGFFLLGMQAISLIGSNIKSLMK